MYIEILHGSYFTLWRNFQLPKGGPLITSRWYTIKTIHGISMCRCGWQVWPTKKQHSWSLSSTLKQRVVPFSTTWQCCSLANMPRYRDLVISCGYRRFQQHNRLPYLLHMHGKNCPDSAIEVHAIHIQSPRYGQPPTCTSRHRTESMTPKNK